MLSKPHQATSRWLGLHVEFHVLVIALVVIVIEIVVRIEIVIVVVGFIVPAVLFFLVEVALEMGVGFA